MKKLIIFSIALLFSATFLPVTAQTDSTTDEGVEFNGLIWATRNVGAPNTFVDNPEDYGLLYQWNRPIGWSNTDPMVNHLGNTTWNNSEPTWNETWINNVCPTGWRVPNMYNDFSTITHEKKYMGELNGVSGRFYENSNGQTLFFPAAGMCVGGVLYYVGSAGYYWTSSSLPYRDPYYASNNAMAWFFDNGDSYQGNRSLTNVYSVRCVKDSNTSGITETENTPALPIGYYNLQGKRLKTTPDNGIYIVLYDNGTSKKVMVSK